MKDQKEKAFEGKVCGVALLSEKRNEQGGRGGKPHTDAAPMVFTNSCRPSDERWLISRALAAPTAPVEPGPC